MGKTNLGRVTFVPRGAYNNETAYKRLDVVEHEGSSYLFLKDSTGIAPTGDNVVTMFLARKGKDFTYSDFTPEQLSSLRGEKGDAFTYENFTPEQLAALKGEDGKNFVYDDFTPEQLESLKGAKGDKGDPGKGLTILGYYGTLDLLKAAVTIPEPGDAYGVGVAAPFNIYVFDGVMSDWVDNGTMSGGGEGDGNVVLIPPEVAGLSNTSTSVEILTAWGGKENFIDICKTLTDSKTIYKLHGGGERFSSGRVIVINSINYIDDNNAKMEIHMSAGSSVFIATTTLANGVASHNMEVQSPAVPTKLPDAIFDLTSQSTSEQILNIFGGIDKIVDIYNKIDGPVENQYDILIADNRSHSNGYSVLHNFGGSWISPENGLDRQIHFAYTSIEPTIEVTRWVIKFNSTSAACEVTKKEVGGASSGTNLVKIPADVIGILGNESTSSEIVGVFGGIQAFNDIVDKISTGNAITAVLAPDADTFGGTPCSLSVYNYVDYSNLEMQIIATVGVDTLILTITVADSVFSSAKASLSALQASDLVSDPSVGGTDKPASAEAVRIVNDKIRWTPDLDSTEEQLCVGEFFIDFDGTKKQVYYKSVRDSIRLSEFQNYYRGNESLFLDNTNDALIIHATGAVEYQSIVEGVVDREVIGMSSYFHNPDSPQSSAWRNTYIYRNRLYIAVGKFEYDEVLKKDHAHRFICNVKYIKRWEWD